MLLLNRGTVPFFSQGEMLPQQGGLSNVATKNSCEQLRASHRAPRQS